MKSKPKYDRMKSIFGNAHFEIAKAESGPNEKELDGIFGEPYTAIGYCMKDGDFWEAGNRVHIDAAKKGQRSDIDAVKKAIDEGKTYDDICDEHFDTASRMHRFIKERVQARDSTKQLNSLKEHYESSLLRPWQQALLDICQEEACPRKIHWIWENGGNVGKSWMTNYLGACLGATILTGGEKKRMAYIFAQNPSGIVIFDLSRTNDTSEDTRKHYLDGIYSLAEDLKNGRVTSTMYDPKTIFFKTPHVIFFANFEPDYTKWSADRYNVIGL